MTQTSNRFFDEIARLMNDAAGVASGVRREFDTLFRTQAERWLRDLDLVKREEFEAVKDMARLAREENEALKARIAALEAKLGGPRAGAAPGRRPASPEATASSPAVRSPLHSCGAFVAASVPGHTGSISASAFIPTFAKGARRRLMRLRNRDADAAPPAGRAFLVNSRGAVISRAVPRPRTPGGMPRPPTAANGGLFRCKRRGLKPWRPSSR